MIVMDNSQDTPSKPNVREIIRMYEPAEGSDVSFESRSKTSQIISNIAAVHHMLIEEQQPKSLMASTQEIQPEFLKTEETIGIKKSQSKEVVPAPRKSLKNFKTNGKNDGKTYKSQTSISHTANGLRIVTEIFPDVVPIDPEFDWIGKKIETDIPKSRILSEFMESTQ